MPYRSNRVRQTPTVILDYRSMPIKSSESKFTSYSLILIYAQWKLCSRFMNFYWKLRMDCFATTFIFDEMWGFPPKEGMSGEKFISLMTRTRNCSFGPQSYTSSFTMGPWTFLSFSIRRSSYSLHEHELSSQKSCSSLTSLRSFVLCTKSLRVLRSL